MMKRLLRNSYSEYSGTFKDSYFSELHSYHSLEFGDEYDDIIDEEQSSDEWDDFEENLDPDIRNHFTLEEMENIIEWVNQHPDYTIANISTRFRKTKSMTQHHWLLLSFNSYHNNNNINNTTTTNNNNNLP